MKDDEVLDEFVDQILKLNLIPLFRDRHEGGSEADGQVVWVHHVLVGELGEVIEEREEVAHDDEDGTGPSLHHVANFDHEFMFGFKF